ncbi:TPA: hypothetical protein ACNTHC_005402, partial [Escherichia coli]
LAQSPDTYGSGTEAQTLFPFKKPSLVNWAFLMSVFNQMYPQYRNISVLRIKIGFIETMCKCITLWITRKGKSGFRGH